MHYVIFSKNKVLKFLILFLLGEEMRNTWDKNIRHEDKKKRKPLIVRIFTHETVHWHTKDMGLPEFPASHSHHTFFPFSLLTIFAELIVSLSHHTHFHWRFYLKKQCPFAPPSVPDSTFIRRRIPSIQPVYLLISSIGFRWVHSLSLFKLLLYVYHEPPNSVGKDEIAL